MKTKLTPEQVDILRYGSRQEGWLFYGNDKECAKLLCRRGLMRYRGNGGIKGAGRYQTLESGRAALESETNDHAKVSP